MSKKTAKKETTKKKAAKKRPSTKAPRAGKVVTISAASTKLLREVARLESKGFDQVLAEAIRHHHRDRMGVFVTQFMKGNR